MTNEQKQIWWLLQWQGKALWDDLTFLHGMIEYLFETFACANRRAGPFLR
jgi:hypothetical protein